MTLCVAATGKARSPTVDNRVQRTTSDDDEADRRRRRDSKSADWHSSSKRYDGAGNYYKLLNQSFHYDARKYCFSARIVNILNSLPNNVVDVNNANQFKARLDKFWMHQDVKFDFTADLTGIGDRSVRVICDV